MRAIYIANDGTVFDDEWDCKEYEWKLSHLALKEVRVLDERGRLLKDIFSEDTYNKSFIVIIKTPEAVIDFKEFVRWSGFCEFGPINDTGVWRYSRSSGDFVCMKKIA